VELPGLATRDDLLAEVLRREINTLRPQPKLTLSEWAEKYAVLSRQTSASPGRFRPFGYQRGILDAFTDPRVKQVICKKSARIGWTKIIDTVTGYFIHQDPCPIMIVQPRVEDAQDYSESEIKPMLADTPVLHAITGDLKERDSDQKILKRVFRNGASIRFVGANSPGGFRRVTVRIVLFDEVDGYPEGAGEEGDQIALGIKRTETFWNRKIGIGSTPTIRGQSRIEKAYAESDMRRYYVPCPHCGHKQTLRWENLRWDRSDDASHPIYGNHLPNTAHFVCEENGCIIEEHHKHQMIEKGEWRAERPFDGIAGFHIWSAYSLFPNAAWRYIAGEFLRARKDPIQLRTFVNLVLGEEWEEESEKIDSSSLIHRGENYGPRSAPSGIRLVTAGVDVQGDRLEGSIFGFGHREESWALAHEVFRGDPAEPYVWELLDKWLQQRIIRSDGRELRIVACCIDSGGHHANAVFSFTRPRRARRLYAIKGAAGPRPIWPKRESRTSSNQTVFILGVDTAKDAIYGRLRISKQGPGYIHFPVGDAFDQEYFDQLTSEKVVTRKKLGRAYRVWEAMRERNEALDCFVYALAARASIPVKLEAAGTIYGEAPPPVAASSAAPTEATDPLDMEGGADMVEPVATVAESPPPPPTSGVKHSAFIEERRGGWFDRRR